MAATMLCSRSPLTPSVRHASKTYRKFATATTPTTSPFGPRHLLSIADLSPNELSILIRNALRSKQAVKFGHPLAPKPLAGQTIALMFSKRSTRTRVSTEAAVCSLGAHPMFLGSGDIQLGVNESLYDTSVVISSMVSAIVARVNGHADVADLAKHSTVPVINALSDAFHPLQTIADYLTVYEAFHERTNAPQATGPFGLGLEGLKIAWVGDANNVLYDLAIGAMKLGVDVAVATPPNYGIPDDMRQMIQQARGSGGAVFEETNVPEEAVKNADVIVTDTWVSMGQEEEAAKRMEAFKDFRITTDLATRGGAKQDWKFMHCLPRHPEEVEDAVFYSPRSLVFPEAANRLWAAISAIDSFVVQKGEIKES